MNLPLTFFLGFLQPVSLLESRVGQKNCKPVKTLKLLATLNGISYESIYVLHQADLMVLMEESQSWCFQVSKGYPEESTRQTFCSDMIKEREVVDNWNWNQ